MAKYRPVYTKLWKDPDFQELNSTQKLLFVYLFTNEATNESGVYPITTRSMSYETNINRKRIKKYLDGSLPNICYDFQKKCVFVFNFLSYNGMGRPDLVKVAIENENEKIVTPLWMLFKKRYPHYDYLNGYEEVNQDFTKTLSKYVQGINRNSNRNRDRDSNRENNKSNKEYKYKVAEFVKLKKKEYKKLKDEHGKKNMMRFIEKLNNYKGSSGKTYQSDYYAICNWVIDEVMKEINQQPLAPDYDHDKTINKNK